MMLEVEHGGVAVARSDLVVVCPDPGPDTEEVLAARHQDSPVGEVADTNTVEGLQPATLVLVILPGRGPALPPAVPRLGAGRAGEGGGEGGQAVVAVAGVEGRQEDPAVGLLSEHNLPRLETLRGSDKPPPGFVC